VTEHAIWPLSIASGQRWRIWQNCIVAQFAEFVYVVSVAGAYEMVRLGLLSMLAASWSA
jgi:hypothetical protein